jgi:hypothetical protein
MVSSGVATGFVDEAKTRCLAVGRQSFDPTNRGRRPILQSDFRNQISAIRFPQSDFRNQISAIPHDQDSILK